MYYLQVKVFKKENTMAKEEIPELLGIFAAESQEVCLKLVKESLKLTFSAIEGEWEERINFGLYKQIFFISSKDSDSRSRYFRSAIFVVDGIDIITEARKL